VHLHHHAQTVFLLVHQLHHTARHNKTRQGGACEIRMPDNKVLMQGDNRSAGGQPLYAACLSANSSTKTWVHTLTQSAAAVYTCL
jgi:hypothetical protein